MLYSHGLAKSLFLSRISISGKWIDKVGMAGYKGRLNDQSIKKKKEREMDSWLVGTHVGNDILISFR